MGTIVQFPIERTAEFESLQRLECMKRATEQTIRDLIFVTEECLQQAIAAAFAELDRGGTFPDAMDAAGRIAMDGPRIPFEQLTQAQLRQAQWARRKIEIARGLPSHRTLESERLRIASEIIRDRCRGKPEEEIEQAIAGARRAISGNATVGLALICAIDDEFGDA